MRVVSLFSGAGGLDIGFIEAGFNVVWANDYDKNACESYTKNIGAHTNQGDINHYLEDIAQLQDIDLVIGGPPCQGFSVAGKMDPNDERSKHVWTFTNVVERLNPQAFVMENVKALGKLKKWEPLRKALLDQFRALGYSTNYVVLNASEFEVPQARERVFFIGFKGNSNIIPDLDKMLHPYKTQAPFVREALSFLDKAGIGNNTSLCKAKITPTSNPVLRKSPYAGMLFNGAGRPVKIDGYCATLPASMGGNKTPIIDEKALYEHKENWIISYHEHLQEGGTPITFDEIPSHLRRLTVEEAATIQTFPKNYHFCGSQSSKFKQIGNAVPCRLAYHIARMIMECLIDDQIEKFIINLPHQLEIKI
ncbi:MAG: DNA cytosine methyltransferase [Aureispira sp.]